MRPRGSRRSVLLKLVAMGKREDLVLDHQGRTIRPVEDEVHVAALAIDPASGIRSRKSEGTEGGIRGLGQHVEEPADEVAVEQLARAVHEAAEWVALDAASDLFEVVRHSAVRVSATPAN